MVSMREKLVAAIPEVGRNLELRTLKDRQQNLEATIRGRFEDARKNGEVVVRVGSLTATLREVKKKIGELEG